MNESCSYGYWDLQNNNAVIKEMIDLFSSIFPMKLVTSE